MSNERNIFEVATRNKMRFVFRGLVSVEDLWDLSTKDLDSIFKTLNAQLKQEKEESLLEVKTQQNEELDTKVQIVKYIVQVKLAEEQARLNARKIKEQKQKILEILSVKEDTDLQNKSTEELTKMLNELEK